MTGSICSSCRCCSACLDLERVLSGRDGAAEESKPDSVLGDHLSAGRLTVRPPMTRGAPYPGLGEQRRRPCLGLQQGGLPFSLPCRPPKRPTWALVSVALTIGYPTPACAGHLALRCLDFPLTPSRRSERSPFLRRTSLSIPGQKKTPDRSNRFRGRIDPGAFERTLERPG